MKAKINPDLWGAVLMMLVSAGLLIAIPFQIEAVEASSNIGPRFIPQLMAGIMMVISILDIIRSMVRKEKQRVIEIDFQEQKRVLIMIVCMILFCLLSVKISMVVPAILLGCVMLKVTRAEKNYYYIVVIVTGIILYLASKYIIHVQF